MCFSRRATLAGICAHACTNSTVLQCAPRAGPPHARVGRRRRATSRNCRLLAPLASRTPHPQTHRLLLQRSSAADDDTAAEVLETLLLFLNRPAVSLFCRRPLITSLFEPQISSNVCLFSVSLRPVRPLLALHTFWNRISVLLNATPSENSEKPPPPSSRLCSKDKPCAASSY
jgi:hypothetical protein